MFLSLQSVILQVNIYPDFMPINQHRCFTIVLKKYFCQVGVKDLCLYWTQKSDLLSFSSGWHLINEALQGLIDMWLLKRDPWLPCDCNSDISFSNESHCVFVLHIYTDRWYQQHHPRSQFFSGPKPVSPAECTGNCPCGEQVVGQITDCKDCLPL